MLFEDREAAEEILSALSAEPRIVFATLYKDDSTLLAGYACTECGRDSTPVNYPAELPGAHLSLHGRAGSGHTFGKGHVELVQGVTLEKTPVGSLLLRYDLGEYSLRIKNYLLIGFFVFSLSIVIAFIICTKLQKLVSAPIINLTRLMTSVSESKDFSLRAAGKGKDEIGTLYSGFHDMLEQIQIREKGLEDRSNELLVTKSRLEHLLTSSPAVIYSGSHDKNFNYNFISSNVESILGFTPEYFMSNPGSWLDRVHPSNLTNLVKSRKAVLDRDFHIHEYRFRHVSGSYLWLRDEFRMLPV